MSSCGSASALLLEEQRLFAPAASAATAAAAALASNSSGVSDNSDVGNSSSSSSSSSSSERLLGARFWLPGLLASTVLCMCVLSPPMNMPPHEPLIAVLLALLGALLAVRALGQSDLNPVSGVGKVSQVMTAARCVQGSRARGEAGQGGAGQG